MILDKKEYDFHLRTYRRALEKATRMKIPMAELDDLAGLRVIVGTLSEQKNLCYFFRDGLRGTKHKVLKDRPISRQDGYRAHHRVLEISPEYTGTWDACKVEVQVQTVFQSAFNMLSRSWVYKARPLLDESWYESFHHISKQLKEIEIQANELQSMFSKSTSGDSDNVPISPLAFQAIVREVFNETCDEDSANWYSLYYRRAGLENCKQLRIFFKNEHIEEVFQKYKTHSKDSPKVIGVFAESRYRFWHFCGPDPKTAIEILEKVCDALEEKASK